jgi:hypothetical protein
MYRRPCAPTQWKKDSIPYCPPTPSPGSAITESERMILNQPSFAWVTAQIGPTCIVDVPPQQSTIGSAGSGTVTTRRVLVPVAPAAPMPYVQVGTTPASLTTQQRVSDVNTQAYNPYDPASRFTQYFPPAPIPYICPMRMPNNDPKPSTRVCVPITRFHGSAYEASLSTTTVEYEN